MLEPAPFWAGREAEGRQAGGVFAFGAGEEVVGRDAGHAAVNARQPDVDHRRSDGREGGGVADVDRGNGLAGGFGVADIMAAGARGQVERAQDARVDRPRWQTDRVQDFARTAVTSTCWNARANPAM